MVELRGVGDLGLGVFWSGEEKGGWEWRYCKRCAGL